MRYANTEYPRRRNQHYHVSLFPDDMNSPDAIEFGYGDILSISNQLDLDQ